MCFGVEYCLIVLYFMEEDILYFERLLLLDFYGIKEKVVGFLVLFSDK